MIKPVIVCISKNQENYIDDFIFYHLDIGFEKIYIYDNNDFPKYKSSGKVIVNHLPFDNYSKPIKYIAIDHFKINYLFDDNITHALHLDVDDYIVLKKHKTINEFIEYEQNMNMDMNKGICINSKLFGLPPDNINKYTINPQIPLILRFIECGDCNINKIIFDKKYFDPFSSTSFFNSSSFAQINSYKCKSFEEFNCEENDPKTYNSLNKYDKTDFTLFIYFSKIVDYERIAKYYDL